MPNFNYNELKTKLKRDREEADKKRINAKELNKKQKKEAAQKKKQIGFKIKLISKSDRKDLHNDSTETELVNSINNNVTSKESNVTASADVSDLKTESTEPMSNNSQVFKDNDTDKRPISGVKERRGKGGKKKKSALSTKALEDKRNKDRERQRKRRLAMSVAELEKKREYDRNYKERKIADGTWKKFRTSMNEREKRKDQKLVRERVRKCRERKKESKITRDFLECNTPPDSPSSSVERINIPLRQLTPNNAKRSLGRKKKNLNRSKIYRLLKKK